MLARQSAKALEDQGRFRAASGEEEEPPTDVELELEEQMSEEEKTGIYDSMKITSHLDLIRHCDHHLVQIGRIGPISRIDEPTILGKSRSCPTTSLSSESTCPKGRRLVFILTGPKPQTPNSKS